MIFDVNFSVILGGFFCISEGSGAVDRVPVGDTVLMKKRSYLRYIAEIAQLVYPHGSDAESVRRKENVLKRAGAVVAPHCDIPVG